MRIIYFFIIILIILCGCKERYNPKPTGYLRFDLEDKIDTRFSIEKCQFYFFAPSYYEYEIKNSKECWFNLRYIKHGATIHLTYKPIQDDLFMVLEESRNMVYKHTIKANAINEKLYRNAKNNTYGTLYDISGETASSVQFHLTDSVNNFLRGSLYFDVSTNEDSLKPLINYLRQDVLTIMETLVWSN
tara:strand:+ start:143 stop:706 length:564 start_codon:yes stop_codon:yes gene_type:complete